MDQVQIEGVLLTPKKILKSEDGSIYHILNNEEKVLDHFGEAYVSTILPGRIKGWKKHKLMRLNITVLRGLIKFVIYDDRTLSKTKGRFMELELSPEKYKRLTLAPDLWFAFQNLSNDESMLINIANLKHDPDEVERLEINKIKYF